MIAKATTASIHFGWTKRSWGIVELMSSSDNKSGPPERGRQEMERDWKLRQENVLPLEAAQNEGRFYGWALKGSRPLTGVQRTGILLIGLQAVGFAAMMLFHEWPYPKVGPSLKSFHQHLPDVPLIWMPVIFLGAALGLRFCWVALKPYRNTTASSLKKMS
jgi:hypothetical protein